MLSRSPTVCALLRRTSTHRPATSQPRFTRSFSRLQNHARTPPTARPSLSLTYRALPIHLLTSAPTPLHTSRSNSTAVAPIPTASATQWTHFNTAYSYSSVRTFASSRVSRLPAPTAETSAPTTNSEAAERIEEAIEDIQNLYRIARDEFEIAAEATEKNSTYAPDDRVVAREELDKLLECYNGVIENGDRAVAEEVMRRVGGGIRELEQAVRAMEEQGSHEH